MVFPRTWRTDDGGTLVELSEGSFVRFTPSGAMTEVYGAWGSSDADGMFGASHGVEGPVLVRYAGYDGGGGCARSSHAVVRGLVPLEPEDCPVPLDGIEERVARFRQQGNLR